MTASPRRRGGALPGRLRDISALPGRLRRSQLRTRVLAGVMAVILVTLAVFDVAAVTGLRRYLMGETQTELNSLIRAYRIFGGRGNFVVRGHRLSHPASRRPAERPVPRRQIAPGLSGPPLLLPSLLDQYYVEAMIPGQPRVQLINGNRDLVPQQLPADLRTLLASHRTEIVTSSNGRSQLLLGAARIGNATFVVTTSLDGLNRTVGRLQLIVVIGSVAAALLVAVGIGLVVRRGLRPIEVMAAQAGHISAGALTERVSPQDPRTEVGRLGAALNGMLTRIEAFVAEREASQQATRRFFADASHELRNPLASLRANAELYQQGALAGPGQVDEAMRRIAAEAQRMSGLVDDMLRLARLDQHPERRADPVDVSALIADCAQRAEAAGPGRGWRRDIEPGLVVIGDAELLRRAVDNLLANVRDHTPAGATAVITAAARDDRVVIEVSDDGPGVAADQLGRIFDRFYRADGQGGRPGSGLGLAIVSAVATAHYGAARAGPGPRGGLAVTITLPRPQPAPAAPAVRR